MTSFYSWLARSVIRHRGWYLAVWAEIILLAAICASQTEHALSVGGFSLPGTEFYATSEVLSRDLNISSDKAAILVFHSPRLLVTDKGFHDAVQGSVDNLQTQKLVGKIDTFYSTGIPDLVSRDNHTTYALATLKGSERELEVATPELRRLVRSSQVEASIIGQTVADYDVEQASADDLARVERFTFPIVLILLVLVFGSLIAAGVPLALGAGCVVVSLTVIFFVAQVTELSIFALNTATMIGLGLSIDFSLIMVSRFREELAKRPLEEAIETTLQTAGRSITFSGITLMLTMAVLALFPVMIIRSIALSIAIVAAVAVLSGLLLLPPLLVVLAPYLNRLDLRKRIPWLNRSHEGVWARWAHTVMRRPWLSLVLALAVLGLMAFPATRLQRRGVTVQVLPESSESRRTYELVQREFGPGEPGPIFIVLAAAQTGGLWQPNVLGAVYDFYAQAQADPRVAHIQSLASLIPNPSPEWIRSLGPDSINSNPDRKRIAERVANLNATNTTTVLIVYPRKDQTDPETVRLLNDLRAQARSTGAGLPGVQILVGGGPAQHYDFDKVVYDQFPILLGLSLLVTFVILMLFFHSLLLPVKAILLNLVSLVASYGLLVLVFQFGWGDFLLGFHSLGAILSYTPVLLFSILFGLSTDYEVFLLTRVREYYRRGYSNEESVALGLEHTAGIITAAGLVTIGVFGSFALTQVLVIKELGFGLAVAILLDTTLVRMVLVPASMKLMGNWNWWMPRAIDHLVPEIDEAGPPAPRPLRSIAGGQ